MIDIIIPVLDEEQFLENNANYYSELKDNARVIFVDGGSTDRTVQVASRYGEVISSKKGRANQKNAGVSAASSDNLLFLHVDSLIDISSLPQIEKALDDDFLGGCLTMKVQDKAFIFRLFERIVNSRARYLKVIDGDLGQFIKRQYFFKIGGYDDVPIMEDILFAKKMKSQGRIAVLPNIIGVSSREWKNKGFLKLLYRYFSAYIRLWSGSLTKKNKRDPNECVCKCS